MSRQGISRHSSVKSSLVLTSIAVFISLILFSPILAEELPHVIVKIRAIRASQPGKSLTEAPQIDPRLSDISDKLRSFDFKKFRMISEQERRVPFKKKESIDLTEKTRLAVRPLYMEPERVGMWLKWTDFTGEEVLLDTRMHFTRAETVVTGTNCNKGDKAVILAISARSQP